MFHFSVIKLIKKKKTQTIKKNYFSISIFVSKLLKKNNNLEMKNGLFKV